jgi:hypothetical protein
MSTSSANSDDRLGRVAQPLRCTKDEGLLSALSSVPDFAFADATGHPVDRKSDVQAQPATRSSLEMTGDSDVKRCQTTIILPNERQFHQPHGNRLPPRDLTPEWVIQPHGYVGQGRRTPRLQRRGYSSKKSLVTSAIAAMCGGSLVAVILMLVQGADFPSLPKFASAARPLPAPPSTDFRSIINLSEAERIAPAASLQPTMSLQPTAQSENQPTDGRTEVTLPQIVPGSEYERIVGKTAAMRQPPSIAMAELTPMAAPQLTPMAAPELTPMARPEPTPITTPERRPSTTLDSAPIARVDLTPESPAIARPEPTPASPAINQAPPQFGKAMAAARAGFLFADSNVRYLTRADLQTLSADRLHIARNEIFARRGRHFKDDGLRAYFSQFPWYQPRAWDVALGPVEKANVGLIQSIEAPAAASRGITEPIPAQTKVENSAAFADPSRRYLTPEELQGLSADELVIIRNEIFARRGRYFKDDALRSYFSQFPWYQPYAWDVPLSPIEQANVKLVQSLELAASTPRPASKAGRSPPT